MSDEIEFKQGSLVEFPEFYVVLNIDVDGDMYTCRHVIRTNDKWCVPRAIKTYMMDGYIGSLVCLDCILDAAREIQDSE